MLFDAKRFSKLESDLESLQKEVQALRREWTTVQVDLADTEEKVLRTYKRLAARERKSLQDNPPADNGETKREISPAAKRLLGMTL